MIFIKIVIMNIREKLRKLLFMLSSKQKQANFEIIMVESLKISNPDSLGVKRFFVVWCFTLVLLF